MKYFRTTKYTNWLRRSSWVRIIMLLALFTLNCSLFISEARAQEAFYVYRNDGDFNGFFYDQIVRMGYSKFDLDSVEHDCYVIQEIETKDSLYRIPLASIDSIGFQQPEILFAPQVKFIDDSDIIPYITEVGKYRITLKKETPKELLPKSGDVWMSFNNELFDVEYRKQDYGGYVKKVARVYDRNYPDKIIVDLGDITDLKDIFVQFISTEQVFVDENGNESRRLAGFNKAVKRAEEGEYKKALIDFSGTIKREVDLGGNATLSLEAGLELSLVLQMVYNISWKRVFVKTMFDTEVDVTPKVAIKSSLYDFEGKVVGLPKFVSSIKFPAVCPLFQTRPLPDLVVRGGGELAASISLPPMSFVWRQEFTFDTNDFPIASYSNYLKEPDEEKQKENEQNAIEAPWDASLSLSGFVQAGVKITANIETNDWFEKLFSSDIGVEIFCGPKIEGKFEFSKSAFDKDGAYGVLKDNNITIHPFSIDLDAYAQVKTFWTDPERTSFFDLSKQFLSMKYFLLPDFKKSEATFSTEDGKLTVKHFPSRFLLWSTYIGTAVYDYKGDRVRNELVGSYFVDAGSKYETVFEKPNLRCGTYQAGPYVLVAGHELPVKSAQTEFKVTPVLRMGDNSFIDSMQVGCGAQDLEVFIHTNSPNITITHENIIGKWITTSIEDFDEKTQSSWLKIKVNENPSVFQRSCDIILTAKDGNYVARDTLRLQQAYGQEGIKVARVDCTGYGSGSQRRWGLINGESFEENEEVTFFTNNIGEVPVNCRRDGNLLYLTYKADETPVNIDQTNSDGFLKSTQNYSYELELTIDCSKEPGFVVEGLVKYDKMVRTEYYREVDWGSFINHKESFLTQQENKEIRWKGNIPANNKTTRSWSDKTVTDGRQFVGSIEGGGVTGSYYWEQYEKTDNYEHYPKKPERNVDNKRETNEITSFSANSAGFSIEIGY